MGSTGMGVSIGRRLNRQVHQRRGGAAVMAVFLGLFFGIATPAAGAQARAADALTEAQRLRDAGDFAAAAQILRAQLIQEPANGDVARLLAQTLYWLQDINGARAVYDAALARHPQDTTLRLQYGRMLAETGQPARARDVVTPLQEIPSTQARRTRCSARSPTGRET